MSSISRVPAASSRSLDGGQHAQQEQQDAARTLEIGRRGYRLIRFWNNDVMHNLAGVLEIIRRELD